MVTLAVVGFRLRGGLLWVIAQAPGPLTLPTMDSATLRDGEGHIVLEFPWDITGRRRTPSASHEGVMTVEVPLQLAGGQPTTEPRARSNRR